MYFTSLGTPQSPPKIGQKPQRQHSYLDFQLLCYDVSVKLIKSLVCFQIKFEEFNFVMFGLCVTNHLFIIYVYV